jgi:hypothetical protein
MRFGSAPAHSFSLSIRTASRDIPQRSTRGAMDRRQLSRWWTISRHRFARDELPGNHIQIRDQSEMSGDPCLSVVMDRVELPQRTPKGRKQLSVATKNNPQVLPA